MKTDVQKGAMYLTGVITVLAVCCGCNSSKGIYENVRGRHLIIEHGGKTLFWFSGIHSNDPQSPMFEDIREAIQDVQPSYILVEGGFNESRYPSEEEAILNGESAFAAHIARNMNIPCGNIEPSDAQINDYLAAVFPTEKILAMYAFRQMHQWQREAGNKNVDFENAIVNYMSGDVVGGLPDDAERDISAILTAYAGYPVDNSNWQQVDAFGLIYAENGKLHDVSRATIDYRNQYILEILPALFETYDTIFIVMGFDHAEALKADLEAMMEHA
jgi:hypothetical protein